MSITTQLHAAVDDQKVLAVIAEALKSIQFGTVEITLHNGQVVQVERREKIRFQAPSRTS